MRTVFDPYSSEYIDTTLDRKLEILKIIKENGIDINELLNDFKEFYTKEKKIHVFDVADEGLARLLNEETK